MKKSNFTFLLFALLIFASVQTSFAKKVPGFKWNDVRAIGMGNTAIANDGYRGTFIYNPALLKYTQERRWEFVNAHFSLSQNYRSFFDFLDENRNDLSNFPSVSNNTQNNLIKQFSNFTNEAEATNAGFMILYTKKDFAHAFLIESKFSIQGVNGNSATNTPINVTTTAQVDYTFIFGKSHRFFQDLTFGYNIKPFFRQIAVTSGDTTNSFYRSPFSSGNDSFSWKPGISTDLGFTFKPGLAMRERLTFALVWQDIFGSYDGSRIQDNLIAGIGFKATKKITILAEYEDILNEQDLTNGSNREFFDHVRLGAELFGHWHRVRVGVLNQRFTFGFGLHFWGMKFEYAYAARNNFNGIQADKGNPIHLLEMRTNFGN